VQVVPTGATEYLPAAHAVHTELAVTVQPAALLDVPAAHTVQAEHDVALAADHVLPATQLAQVAFVVAVQGEARYLPAAHTLEPQLRQGA
jgi:hypothetical protein